MKNLLSLTALIVIGATVYFLSRKKVASNTGAEKYDPVNNPVYIDAPIRRPVVNPVNNPVYIDAPIRRPVVNPVNNPQIYYPEIASREVRNLHIANLIPY